MTVKNIVDKALKDNPIFKACKDADKTTQTKFIDKSPEDQWQGIATENANFNTWLAFHGAEEISRRKPYGIKDEDDNYKILAIPDEQLGVWKIDAFFRLHKLNGEPWTHHEEIPFSHIADENDIKETMCNIINKFS